MFSPHFQPSCPTLTLLLCSERGGLHSPIRGSSDLASNFRVSRPSLAVGAALRRPKSVKEHILNRRTGHFRHIAKVLEPSFLGETQGLGRNPYSSGMPRGA